MVEKMQSVSEKMLDSARQRGLTHGRALAAQRRKVANLASGRVRLEGDSIRNSTADSAPSHIVVSLIIDARGARDARLSRPHSSDGRDGVRVEEVRLGALGRAWARDDEAPRHGLHAILARVEELVVRGKVAEW